MASLLLFLTGIGLSVFFCALPGAVNTEALRRGIRGGFRPALMVELGSCIGDATWAIIALAGLSILISNDLARIALGVFGFILLLFLAYRSFSDFYYGISLEGEVSKGRNDFLTGALISLGNPSQIAFWVGIGGSVVGGIVPEPVAWDFVIFLAGYLLGSVIWCLAYSALVAYGRRYIGPKLFRAISLVCAVIFTYLGVSLLIQALTQS